MNVQWKDLVKRAAPRAAVPPQIVKGPIHHPPKASKAAPAPIDVGMVATRVGGSPGAASTNWDPSPKLPPHQSYGVMHSCDQCGQKWYNINPELGEKYRKMWEREALKSIALHMKLRHSGVKK